MAELIWAAISAATTQRVPRFMNSSLSGTGRHRGTATAQQLLFRHLPYLAICLLGALSLFSDATAETTIVIQRGGEPIGGIEVEIVRATSGDLVHRAASNDDGLVEVPNLEAGSLYQAQTSDGSFNTRSFGIDESVVLDLPAQVGWGIAGRLGFDVGSSPAEYEKGIYTADESGALGKLAIELQMVGRPTKMFVSGVRPFIETGVDFSLSHPDGPEDSTGSSLDFKAGPRWTLGAGLLIPVSIFSGKATFEPAVMYGLNRSKATERRPGLSAESDSYVSHSITGRVGMGVPLGRLLGANVVFDLGMFVRAVVDGSGELESGIKVKEGVSYGARSGVRATFNNPFES